MTGNFRNDHEDCRHTLGWIDPLFTEPGVQCLINKNTLQDDDIKVSRVTETLRDTFGISILKRGDIVSRFCISRTFPFVKRYGCFILGDSAHQFKPS